MGIYAAAHCSLSLLHDLINEGLSAVLVSQGRVFSWVTVRGTHKLPLTFYSGLSKTVF